MNQLTYAEYLDFYRWWQLARFGHERHNYHAALTVLPWAIKGTTIEQFIFPTGIDPVEAYLEDLQRRREEKAKAIEGPVADHGE